MTRPRPVPPKERARLLLELFQYWTVAPPNFRCGYCCTESAMRQVVLVLHGVGPGTAAFQVATTGFKYGPGKRDGIGERVGIRGLLRLQDRRLMAGTLEALESEDLAKLPQKGTTAAIKFCLNLAEKRLDEMPNLKRALGTAFENPFQ